MIDFHTHILPKIDDGAKSTEESLALLDMLIEQGITCAVLTPHCYFDKFPEIMLAERKIAFDKLTASLGGRNIRLVQGCELFLPKARLTSNLHKFAISGTKYLLTELSYTYIYDHRLYSDIENIIKYTGLIPIIAHAERYKHTLLHPESIYNLIQCGALIQMNTSSLFDERTVYLATAMLEREQVHVLGTDCHNISMRPPVYEDAKYIIRGEYGELFDRLQQNMADMLDNKGIKIPPSRPIKRNSEDYK